jgi:hypothetical protein
MNTIIIVLGVILLVVIFYLMFQDWFSGKTKLTQQQSLMETITSIPSTDLSVPDATRFTYSIWVYVNSWNTNAPKLIFGRKEEIALYLDKDTATLKLQFNPMVGAPLTTNYTDTNTTAPEYIDVTNNFPLQKWVCVLVSVDNNIIDVYLDGKMIKSVFVNNDMPLNARATSIVFGSGWDAYISKFERTIKPTDPKSAWDKYMEGNGGSTLSNALGNMNINVSVLKDNVETTTFSLF